MTQTANKSGFRAERWTKEDFDLSRPSGYSQAARRLKELKPKRLWLSPECGPYSIMQNANQLDPDQTENLKHEVAAAKHAVRHWENVSQHLWNEASQATKSQKDTMERRASISTVYMSNLP